MMLPFIKQKKFIRSSPKNKSGLGFSIVHKIVPVIILFIALQIASQNCARDLTYDINLVGKPLFIFKKQPIYPFWAIVSAYISSVGGINKAANDIVYQNLKIMLPAIVIAIIVYFLLVYVRTLHDEKDKDFLNSGKWATLKEIKSYGLLDDSGVVIGQSEDAYVVGSMQGGSCKLTVRRTGQIIRYNMNVCAMVLAGSRLGKGVSTVVPTLMDFKYSVITVDPKGENFEITGGWRMLFSYVYKYCPVSKESLCFNHLMEIDKDNAFRDANMIAQILTAPSNPESNADPHWQETAKVLITATILHCLCSDYEDKSLPGVYKYLSSANLNPNDKGDAKKKLLKNMITSRHCTKEIHSSICSYANQILAAADEEMGSIFSSALESLSIFNDDKVAFTSRTSDFCLDDFKYSKTPISWYMTIPFADLDRLKSLLRLNIEFVCRKFSQDATSHGKEVLKNRILFLIDEFPTLGKMEVIETFAGILNGYGISFLWICQSKSQIDKLYGQNAPILEHCRFIWTYAISDHNVAEYFSKRVGNEGVIKQNTSTSGSRYDFGMNNISVSNDITERPLITPTEIETLPCNSGLLITQGGYSYLFKKVAYYSDPRYMDKAKLPVPSKRKDLLKQTVTSRVLRDGDEKWFEDFSNANEVLDPTDEIAEMDIPLDDDPVNNENSNSENKEKITGKVLF